MRGIVRAGSDGLCSRVSLRACRTQSAILPLEARRGLMPHFAFPRSSPSCRNCRLAPLKKRRAADCLATQGGARPTPKSRMHLALLARVFHPPCANAARTPARPRVRPTSSHTTAEPCRFRDATDLPLTHPRHHLSSPFAFFICPSSLLSLSPTTPRSARSYERSRFPTDIICQPNGRGPPCHGTFATCTLHRIPFGPLIAFET